MGRAAAEDEDDDGESAALLTESVGAGSEASAAASCQALYLSLCCMINAGVYFQYHAVPSCATLLRREFDLSAAQIGTLQSMSDSIPPAPPHPAPVRASSCALVQARERRSPWPAGTACPRSS